MSEPGAALDGRNINSFFYSKYAPGYYERRRNEIRNQAIAGRH